MSGISMDLDSCQHWDGCKCPQCEERRALKARAEKAEADLARAVEERDAALALVDWYKSPEAKHTKRAQKAREASDLLRSRGLLGGGK